MSDRLQRLRTLTNDRLSRLQQAVTDTTDRRPQMPRVASDASAVARQDERQSVPTLLGRSSAGVWDTPEPEPESEAPTLLTQRPQPRDASRVTPRPTPTPALSTGPTLGQVTPGRSVLEVEQEQASHSPGPMAGAAERALNVASAGLGRSVGGKLADTITELTGGPDAERRRAARQAREAAFQEQHPTAARLGDLAGLVGGVGGEMALARYMAQRTAAKAAPLLDDLTRIDDAMANPQPRPVERGDVADELVGGGDTSFDFGAPAPRQTPTPPPVAATPPAPAPAPDLPPLDPAVAKRYKNRSTDNLLAYYDELAERQGREGFVAVRERKQWTRQTDGAGVISGSTISNAGGRAIGAAQTAARVSDNVEAVLRHRGVSADDLMDRFMTAQSRGFQSAEQAYRPSVMSAQYGGESGRRSLSAYGGRSGALGQSGDGAVPLMGALTGGIGGGATGATQGETTGERVRNAVAGAGAGALAGYLLGRGAERIGARTPRTAQPSGPMPARSLRGGVGVIEDAPEVATAGARTADAVPDVSQHARLSKFALDPAGEARLADEIQRVVQAEGLNAGRVVTWDETRELARSMGLDAGALASSSVKRLTGPEMLAVRNLVNSNIDQMGTLSRQLVDATLPEAQRNAVQMEMRSLDAQNVALLSKFVKARSQQGRDLNNLKILAERIDLPDYWLTKGLDFAGPERFTEDVRSRIVALVNAGDRGELVKYMAGLRQASTMDKVETFWKANLLTNPLTHVVNVTSNLTFGVLEQLKNAPGAVADRLMSLATRRRTLSGPSAQAAQASLRGAIRGVGEARQVLRGIPLEDALKRWDIYREVNFDNVILDTYTKTVFRSLGAGDRVFRGAAMQASFAEQARTLAAAEGLTGKALRDRAATLIASPSDEMVLRALTDAEQAVFMDPTAIGKLLGNIAKAPGGAFIVPFTRTPGAIATRGLEYSPFGLVAGAGKVLNVIQKGLRGKAVPLDVQREAAKLLGRGATGTGIVTLGYKMAEAGLATGTTSRRERSQRETNQLLGRPDGAVKLGDSWYQFNRLEPVGNLLALGANLYAAVNAAGATPSEVAGRAAVSLVRGTVDQPFLTGPRQILDAIEDPAQTKRIAQNIAGGFIPASSFLGAVARGTDPEFRQSTDVADALQARIPGLSRKLPPHLDQFGEPAKREGGLVGAMLNPVRITRDKTTDSPLLREMAQIGFTMSRRRRTADRDDAAVRRLVESEGGALRQYMEKLIQSSSYQRADEDDKREMMSRVVSRIRTATGRQSRLERLQEALDNSRGARAGAYQP